jgi:Lipocalin-like domain
MKTMKRKIALTVVVALGALSSTSYAQSQDHIAKQFVGMWRLVSWPQRLADGTMRQNPLSAGYIIYTDTNHMCYVNMNPNRPKWNWATAPTETQALSGMGNTGFNAYCATVEIHANEGFVLHHVDVDKVPNNVGRIRKRWFTFQGRDRVSLRIDTPELNPPVVESTLTWERVTK